MVVLYYTSAYFLDVAIETIKCFKSEVKLHVVIELSLDSMQSTIIDLNSLDNLSGLHSCEKALGKEKWESIKCYFSGVENVMFLVHKHKRAFSFHSVKMAGILGKYIQGIGAEIVHFDTITSRAIGLYPYIRSRKVFITIHDPVPHSGESSWKTHVSEFVFFNLAKGYFFYSDFACELFKKNYISINAPKYVIRFQPFSYISQFMEKVPSERFILFFGRLSLYKGIDLLLEAIPKVLKQFPNEKFLIAGRSSFGYHVDTKIIDQYKANIQLIANFLTTYELAKLIEKAKFIVCPYRDATQSGVLMTSFAAGKMVIATNVGAFPEYINDNDNGMLTEPNIDAIASKIIEALENDKYKKIARNVVSEYSEEVGYKNKLCILNAYESN